MKNIDRVVELSGVAFRVVPPYVGLLVFNVGAPVVREEHNQSTRLQRLSMDGANWRLPRRVQLSQHLDGVDRPSCRWLIAIHILVWRPGDRLHLCLHEHQNQLLKIYK